MATAKKKYYKLSLPLTISPSTESWMRPYGIHPEATNFIMFQPDNGRTIPENKKTIVKVIYDNDAIYVAACLTTNQIKLEKRFHNNEFWYIRRFGVLSMALMMASKISIFCQRC
jgi:hypothetical protein